MPFSPSSNAENGTDLSNTSALRAAPSDLGRPSRLRPRLRLPRPVPALPSSEPKKIQTIIIRSDR